MSEEQTKRLWRLSVEIHEDVHFLIDNATPKEVEYLLRSLGVQVAYSNAGLREHLSMEWHFKAQKNLSLSTRRLCDLGLAATRDTSQGKPGYVLTSLGAQVRNLLEADHDLYADIVHYLHYDGYDGSPSARKLFWSYKCCCDVAWARKYVPPASELAAEVQSQIAARFPHIYSQRIGGNFNVGGVSAWKAWLMNLACPPFSPGGQDVIPRVRHNFELVMLALDHVYRARGYRYGDPVVLDEDLLDELARVFFLEHQCCRELLTLATRTTRTVVLTDTFAGTSIKLLAPYGVENI